MSEKEKHIGESLLKSKPKIPYAFKLKDHAVQSRHIAPGAITIDKLGERILPSDVALINFILPWFEVEEIDGEDWLVAYYADDGAIKDFYTEETEEYIEVGVLLSDGCCD